jgi:hypothetical protein
VGKTEPNKKKILDYLHTHPLSTMDSIRRNSGSTKNKQDIKKHLEELIDDTKILYFPKNRKYLAYGNIPQKLAYDVYLEILPILINDFALTKQRIFVHGKVIVPDKYHNGLNIPTSKFVYEKFMSLLNLKLKILKTELKEIKRTFKDPESISKFSDEAKFKVIQFLKCLWDFVNSLDKTPSYEILEEISNRLDREYNIDSNYWMKIKQRNRPFHEVLEILVIKQVLGINSSSAIHLKIIRNSPKKHGLPPNSKRKSPKRLTNTKRLVQKFELPEGIDPFKILELYELEYDRVLGTDSEDYHRMLNALKISIACAIVGDKIPKDWSKKQRTSALKIVGGKKGAKKLVNYLSEKFSKLHDDIFPSE